MADVEERVEKADNDAEPAEENDDNFVRTKLQSVAKRINPPDQQQIIIKHAYEKMLLKTFSFGTQIRTFTNSNDFLQKNLFRCHSSSFRCKSGSFRSIPVSFRCHSGPFRCHSGPFRSIPVHSGVIPVHSGPFWSIPVSFRSIPVHSTSFRFIPLRFGV